MFHKESNEVTINNNDVSEAAEALIELDRTTINGTVSNNSQKENVDLEKDAQTHSAKRNLKEYCENSNNEEGEIKETFTKYFLNSSDNNVVDDICGRGYDLDQKLLGGMMKNNTCFSEKPCCVGNNRLLDEDYDIHTDVLDEISTEKDIE